MHTHPEKVRHEIRMLLFWGENVGSPASLPPAGAQVQTTHAPQAARTQGPHIPPCPGPSEETELRGDEAGSVRRGEAEQKQERKTSHPKTSLQTCSTALPSRKAVREGTKEGDGCPDQGTLGAESRHSQQRAPQPRPSVPAEAGRGTTVTAQMVAGDQGEYMESQRTGD